MIRSMTAFGSARVESEHGSLGIELRTVNNRYLDVSLRLPEELRFAEGAIRELLGQSVARGKVDVRVSYAKTQEARADAMDPDRLAQIAQQLLQARKLIPDLRAPRLTDILSGSGTAENGAMDPQTWAPMCQQACSQALIELQAAREREGQRLAAMMLECAADISRIVDQVQADLPAIQAEHKEKINARLRDALMAASPEGFASIGGAELSARISQESTLFSLRIDVAEELSRLRSHIAELNHILQDQDAGGHAKTRKGSAGKRLDFLFQEMNREANTLGSKAAALSVTRAAIDLKLLIEQMREQAQNLE